MSLEFCVIGSGSSGNSTVVRSPQGVLLIDCGLGPRTTAKRLLNTGAAIPNIRAICITHLDHDHFNPNWIKTLVKYQIALWCHVSRAEDLCRTCFANAESDREIEPLIHTFAADAFSPIDGLRVEAIPFAHDQAGSHGFILRYAGRSAGFATDLGHVPESLIERFSGLDLIALESNYDLAMQQESDRPWFLKNRIMGGHGHLSNDQAFHCLKRILDRSEKFRHPLPEHVVLLHRSQQCNCPNLLRKLFAQDSRFPARLTLAHQHEPTAWLRFNRPAALACQQLSLAWA